MTNCSFKEFKKKIKEDDIITQVMTIRRNHSTLQSALECRYCRARLESLLLWKITTSTVRAHLRPYKDKNGKTKYCRVRGYQR